MTGDIYIVILLFIVAFLYASVGHGGASGYIAVLTLFNVAMPVYKPVVLILNVAIASIAFIQFYRAGYFKWSLAWPFLLTSVLAAFLGSKFYTSEHMYKIILGVALVFPAIRLMGWSNYSPAKKVEFSVWTAMIIGAVIGFIAGFLNIGGVIFLSPVLILLAWANSKESAAVSSLFIVCNSLAGLSSLGFSNIHFSQSAYFWLLAAICGGLAGAYFGSRIFRQETVKKVLSVVLLIAAIKLFFS